MLACNMETKSTRKGRPYVSDQSGLNRGPPIKNREIFSYFVYSLYF